MIGRRRRPAMCHPDRWHVDHDHKTGIVRGLLCHHCNFIIGQAEDDPGILMRAVQYLQDHNRDI